MTITQTKHPNRFLSPLIFLIVYTESGSSTILSLIVLYHKTMLFKVPQRGNNIAFQSRSTPLPIKEIGIWKSGSNLPRLFQRSQGISLRYET